MIPGISDNHEIALAWMVISVGFLFWAMTRAVSFCLNRNAQDASRFATMISMSMVAADAVYIRWAHVSSNSDRTIYIRWFAAACVLWALVQSVRQIRDDIRARSE